MTAGAGEDGYMECHIYVEHGACSCSTGVPGNICPLAPIIDGFKTERNGYR